MARETVASRLARIQAEMARLLKQEQVLKKQAQSKGLKQIVALAKQYGVTSEAVVKALGRRGRGRTRSKAGRKVPPKYRNPANKSQTWTGRGRAPTWVAELKKKGLLESARIGTS